MRRPSALTACPLCRAPARQVTIRNTTFDNSGSDNPGAGKAVYLTFMDSVRVRMVRNTFTNNVAGIAPYAVCINSFTNATSQVVSITASTGLDPAVAPW